MRAVFRLLAVYFSLIAAVTPAYALELINFSSPLPPSAVILANSWLEQNIGITLDKYEGASADLNRDGLNEYILKPQKCYSSDGFCNFIILAESQTGAVLLGKISAKKIALGDSYHGGVQDILAFRSNNNDYEYDVFVWDSLSTAYVLNGRTEG